MAERPQIRNDLSSIKDLKIENAPKEMKKQMNRKRNQVRNRTVRNGLNEMNT